MEGVSTIKKEGKLKKEGGRVKTWKNRWCVLSDGYLCYHDGSNKSGELKGSIPLKMCGEIHAVDYKKKKWCIEIKTMERNYHMCAESEKDMKDWIESLRAAQDEVKVGGAVKRAPNGSNQKAVGSNTEQSQDEQGRGVQLDDFECLKVIGRGSFGKVLQVKYIPDGEIYAMKVLNKKTIIERNEIEHTKAEKSILMKLRSPFLVKLHYSFQTTDRLYFVMDYVNGGELFYHLQREKTFPPDRVHFYASEIVLGLEYLHKEGVIYRDLKPENLLLTANGHICMTDFGISKEGLMAKDDRTATFCGTPEYLAPEVLEGKGYGKEVDWWSFGTLMYEMLTGLPPFYSEDVQLMYSKIMNAKLTLPKSIGENAISLLTGLLERDPGRRLADPDKIKAHPYFADVDWEKLGRLEVKAPWIPPVTSKESTAMISTDFLNEAPELSCPEDNGIPTGNNEFGGFTFEAPRGIHQK